MLYDFLKILHILSATLFLTGIVHSCRLWLTSKNCDDSHLITRRIQTQTWTLVIPFCLFQLASGFMLISLKKYPLFELWIVGSIIGFIIVTCCWFGFLYLLLSNQTSIHYRRLQAILLSVGGVVLLSMIFLMTNKISGW